MSFFVWSLARAGPAGKKSAQEHRQSPAVQLREISRFPDFQDFQLPQLGCIICGKGERRHAEGVWKTK